MKRPKWWQIAIGIVGIFAVADGMYQVFHGIRGLTLSKAPPPLPTCDSANAEELVRKLWPANALPFTRIIHPHEIVAGGDIPGLYHSSVSNAPATAMRDIRSCAAAFLQDDQKIHDGAFVFNRSPEDANHLNINVEIRPPDQLAIGNLVFTQQKIKNWNHWNKIAQTDFGKVVFIGKQDNGRAFQYIEYPGLTTAAKSVSVDIQVQDMPYRANMVSGAGLFYGKPPKYNEFCAFLLTSDGIFSSLEYDGNSWNLLNAVEFSLITPGTNNLSLAQEPDHKLKIQINGYRFLTLSRNSGFDLSDAVGVFVTTYGDGNRIELSNFQVDKPIEDRELPVGHIHLRDVSGKDNLSVNK
jgi:hypothetical protein